MNYIFNEEIPSYTGINIITEVLGHVNMIKPKIVLEIMPGCGPISWHILKNNDYIKTYDVVDTWHGGKNFLRKHGLDGRISKSLFLIYNHEFKNKINTYQEDCMKFTPQKEYDLWVLCHDASEDFYKNEKEIIYNNFENLISKIHKDSYILFYATKTCREEYTKALNLILKNNILNLVEKSNNCILFKK